MAAAAMVLAADVGGTNTRLALAAREHGRNVLVTTSVYPGARYVSFELALEAFLQEPRIAAQAPRIAAACFAVAGPVEDGTARLTNLAWVIDARALGRRFNIPTVTVINDFAAAGLGIDELAEHDFLTLQAGEPVAGAHRAIVGAGTGLGVGWLTRDGAGYRVHPSEGGHSSFAPIDELQDELARWLRRDFAHVSWERVLSGAGLARICAFLCERGATPSRALREAMEHGNAPSTITALALAREDPVAESALDLFACAYGAFAGDVSLTTLPHAGCYIAGGIAPKIAAKLEDGTFMRAFVAKGRMRVLLEGFPVKVVLNELVGLKGAAAEALRIAKG